MDERGLVGETGLMGASTGGFVPVRLDAPGLLGPAEGRREGHLLSALLVAVEVAGLVDWRRDILEPFTASRFAAEQRMSWRRLMRALCLLDDRGVASALCRPFRPGRLQLTARSNPRSLLHDRGRPAERFVTLARGALRSIGDHHDLSWVARGLLVFLVLVCDHRNAVLPAGWTKTRLSVTVGLGWRRLTAAMAELADAGLITFTARRGHDLTLHLVARAALVVPTMAPAPTRRQRRRLAAGHPTTAADRAATASSPAAVAAKLVAHYRLPGPPSPALVRAIGEALATGAAASHVLESLCGHGTLHGARDPMAVLCHRATQTAAQLAAARRAADARRQADTAGRAAAAARRQHEDSERRRVEDQGRWIASVADVLPSGAALGLPELLAARPTPVAAHIHTVCQALIDAHPGLDPAELVRRWATQPVAPAALDTAGIGPRSARDGPPGRLPAVREGPTLPERLRAAQT